MFTQVLWRNRVNCYIMLS